MNQQILYGPNTLGYFASPYFLRFMFWTGLIGDNDLAVIAKFYHYKRPLQQQFSYLQL